MAPKMTEFMKNESGEPAIELGKRYKDDLHGIEGVATCYSRYLTGCDRVCLEYVKEGEIHELWFDVTRLKGVEIAKSNRKPGGPQSTAPKRIPR